MDLGTTLFNYTTEHHTDPSSPSSNSESTITSNEGKKPPRPPNSFILYRRDKSRGFQGPRQVNISRAIGQMWRLEPEEVRAAYSRLAEIAKVEHRLKYPTYRYEPVWKKGKKRGGGKSPNEATRADEMTQTNLQQSTTLPHISHLGGAIITGQDTDSNQNLTCAQGSLWHAIPFQALLDTAHTLPSGTSTTLSHPTGLPTFSIGGLQTISPDLESTPKHSGFLWDDSLLHPFSDATCADVQSSWPESGTPTHLLENPESYYYHPLPDVSRESENTHFTDTKLDVGDHQGPSLSMSYAKDVNSALTNNIQNHTFGGNTGPPPAQHESFGQSSYDPYNLSSLFTDVTTFSPPGDCGDFDMSGYIDFGGPVSWTTSTSANSDFAQQSAIPYSFTTSSAHSSSGDHWGTQYGTVNELFGTQFHG